MHNISKKTCFPSTRKVLDFDLNGQHMRNTEVSEGNWVLGCSPDHSTIRPKILSLKSQPSPKDKSERLASLFLKGRKQKVVFLRYVRSKIKTVFLSICSPISERQVIFAIYFVRDCLRNLIFADFGQPNIKPKNDY